MAFAERIIVLKGVTAKVTCGGGETREKQDNVCALRVTVTTAKSDCEIPKFGRYEWLWS